MPDNRPLLETDPIEYLVQHRFPLIHLPSPSIGVGIKEYAAISQQRKETEEYRQELQG
jgi:hypothetical protein